MTIGFAYANGEKRRGVTMIKFGLTNAVIIAIVAQLTIELSGVNDFSLSMWESSIQGYVVLPLTMIL